MSATIERRELEYKSLDEVVADAEQLAGSEHSVVGNHSFAEILRHLALGNDMVTGTIQGPKPPLMIRLMMPLMKRFLLNDKPLKPGFKLPNDAESFFWPSDEISLPDALTYFKESVERVKTKGPLPKHPMFGPMSREQNEKLTLQHCALHMSFVQPV